MSTSRGTLRTVLFTAPKCRERCEPVSWLPSAWYSHRNSELNCDTIGQQCHTRKIRCVTDDGAPKCIRCTKNGLKCVVNKNLQDLLEGEYDWKKAMEQQMESMRASMVDMK